MDHSYEAAQLLKTGLLSQAYHQRLKNYLEYPVKGRSLEDLHLEYAELMNLADEKKKKGLTESYLIGWTSHQPDAAMKWTLSEVESETERKRIYNRWVRQSPQQAVSWILDHPDTPDHSLMMAAVAGQSARLNDAELLEFVRHSSDSKMTQAMLVQLAIPRTAIGYTWSIGSLFLPNWQYVNQRSLRETSISQNFLMRLIAQSQLTPKDQTTVLETVKSMVHRESRMAMTMPLPEGALVLPSE